MEADGDRPPGDGVLAEEPPHAAEEPAGERWVKVAGDAGGGPPDPPDPVAGVELAEGEALPRPARAVRPADDAVDMGKPAEHRLGVRGGGKLDPLRAVRVGDVAKLAVVDGPVAEDEVEVVPAVALAGFQRRNGWSG